MPRWTLAQLTWPVARATRSPSREVSAAASCRPSQYSATARSSNARDSMDSSPRSRASSTARSASRWAAPSTATSSPAAAAQLSAVGVNAEPVSRPPSTTARRSAGPARSWSPRRVAATPAIREPMSSIAGGSSGRRNASARRPTSAYRYWSPAKQTASPARTSPTNARARSVTVHRRGGGQQGDRRARRGAAAQLQLTAEQVGTRTHDRVGADRAETVEQQPGRVGLPAGPGVPGGGQQPGGGQLWMIAQLGGPAQGHRRGGPAVGATDRGLFQLGGEGRIGARRRGGEVHRPAEPLPRRDQHLGEQSVGRAALRERRAGRDHRAHQRLRKGDTSLLHADQTGDLRRGERLDLGAGGCRGPDQGARGAVLVERGEQQHPSGLRWQPVQSGAVRTTERSIRRWRGGQRLLPPPLPRAEHLGEVHQGLRVAAADRGQRGQGRRGGPLGEPVDALALGQLTEPVGEDDAALVLGQRPQSVRRYPVEVGGDVRGEQDGERQVPQSAGDERQHLRGLRVTSVDVVHGGEQRPLPGGGGEQPEHRHRQRQLPVGRAALPGQRAPQQLALLGGQGGGPVEHRVDQTLQAGVRQRGLLSEPRAGEHGAALGVPMGVADQRRPTRSGLSAQQQGTVGVGHAVEQAPDSPALVVPATQHG